MRERGPPEGFAYFEEVLDDALVDGVLALVPALAFERYTILGQPSRREIAFFGAAYRAGAGSAPPLPDAVIAVRDACAARAGLEGGAFEAALLTRYGEGASIGWHQDFANYGPVILGASLLGSCELRLRETKAEGRSARPFRQRLAPRSLYVLAGAARSSWQHSIPQVKELRYSLTFRQLRRGRNETSAERSKEHAR